MKEIIEDTNRWRNIPCSWIGRINIVEMSILPKAIYRFNAFPLRSGTRQGCPLSPLLFKIGLEVLATAIREEKEVKEIQIGKEQSTCSLYYKVTVIKIVWYWHKHRNTDQWNKIGSPAINPHTYGHLNFDKGD